jgi:hypothetical protein
MYDDNKNICPDVEPSGVENLDVHMNEFWQRLTACSDIPLDRLTEICNAERDGRCVVLPCKVGDTVWAYDDVFNQIATYQVDMVELYGHKGMSFYSNWRKNGELMADLDFDAEDIDKTVFLTRAEAEAALLKGDSHEL